MTDLFQAVRAANGGELNILWAGFPNDQSSGYSHIAAKLGEGVQRAGANMLGGNATLWDCMVCLHPPATWIVGMYGRRDDLCFHTMYEASPLPSGWANILNRTRVVWTPSQWSKQLLENHGVTTPIFVSGYGIDHQVYRFEQREDHEGPFRVLIWSETLVSRKNVMRAIMAFQKADLPDAVLEVKLRGLLGMSSDTVIYKPGTKEPDERITIIADYWERDVLVNWLHSGDVGIYLSGGEGFGLMPLEGMATGLPMIVAANSGMLEYLRDDNALLVPCPDLERSIAYTTAAGEEMWTYKPEMDAAISHLEWAYNHRSNLYEIGYRGWTESLRWNWNEKAAEAYAILKRYF